MAIKSEKNSKYYRKSSNTFVVDWISSSYEKSKLHEDCEIYTWNNNKKINRILFRFLWWKQEMHFIGSFTFVAMYVRYIIILLSVGAGLKTLLCRPSTQLVKKITSYLPARHGPLEKLPFICRPARARADF